jgi:hypothetical protein
MTGRAIAEGHRQKPVIRRGGAWLFRGQDMRFRIGHGR